MRRRTWSLVPVSTVIVAVALLLLFGVGCVFALNSYVGALRRDSTSLLDETLRELAHDRNSSDAVAAGHAMAARFFAPTLIIVFIGPNSRVTVFRTESGAGQTPTVAVRERDDRSAEPAATGRFAHLVLGLAAICGLQVQRAHEGRLDIYVKSNDRTLVEAIGGYGLPFSVTLALVFIASALVARFLAAQSLRPLVDVTAALERFAAGDLTPQFVVTNSRGELGALARAYNGAVAQVERAFGERERANAMMRQFIADAGHQLRTPLTVIRGFIAILADPADTPENERRRMLQVMTQQTVVMRVLIDNLMLLDRWENDVPAATLEPIDVTQLVEDITTMLRDANAPRSLRLTAGQTAFARVDPHEFSYAVMNVIDNALKYTAGPVDVDVATRGDDVVLSFADEGPGMPAEIAVHVFDRFFRGQRRDVDGSGLGLAIAKKVVERAGGSVSLETDPNAGTVVRFILPRVTTSA